MKSRVILIAAASAVCIAASAAVTVDPAEYGFDPAAEPAVNSAALQKALEGGNRTVKVAKTGEYRMDRTVRVNGCEAMPPVDSPAKFLRGQLAFADAVKEKYFSKQIKDNPRRFAGNWFYPIKVLVNGSCL